MSTISDDSPPTTSGAPDPRPGYTWVDNTDGVPGHWERARANAPIPPSTPVEPESDPRVTTTSEDLTDDKPSDDDHDDDHDRRDKKGKKRDRDRDDDHDDDHDRRDKKGKKRDRDDDDHDDGANPSDAPPVTPESDATPTAPTGPGPVVRDHRDGDAADSPGGVTVSRPTTGPTVRDHRGEATGPTVRDHRGDTPESNVRDHRGDTAEPNVRDHRGDTTGPMVASNLDEFSAVPTDGPPPVVRDHREPPEPAAPRPEVRDHRDPPAPPPQVRDHRDDDLVGDETAEGGAYQAPELVQAAPEVAVTEFSSGASPDDWETPVTLTTDLDQVPDEAAQAFATDGLEAESADAFAELDTDPMAADPELSAQVD